MRRQSSRGRSPRQRFSRGLLVVLIMAGLGVPLGSLWTLIAPAVPLRMTPHGPVYVDLQPEQMIAADGWFVLLGTLAGVLAAILVWALAQSSRGVAGLVTVTVGAVATGLLAWWWGRQVGLADYQAVLAAAEPGVRLERPPDLRVAVARWWPPPPVAGAPLVPALAAAVTYTLLAAWSRFPTLHPEPPDALPTAALDLAGTGPDLPGSDSDLSAPDRPDPG